MFQQLISRLFPELSRLRISSSSFILFLSKTPHVQQEKVRLDVLSNSPVPPSSPGSALSTTRLLGSGASKQQQETPDLGTSFASKHAGKATRNEIELVALGETSRIEREHPRLTVCGRILVFLAYVALCVMLPVAFQWLQGRHVGVLETALNQPLELRVSGGCHITLLHRGRVGGGVRISYSIERAPSDLATLNATTQTTEGRAVPGLPVALAAPCEAIVELGAAPLPELRLLAVGDRYSSVSLASLNVTGAVTVSGDFLDLRTRGLAAESFETSLRGGVIELVYVWLRDAASGAVVALDNGDLILGPRGVAGVSLDWDQPCGFVCVPDGSLVNTSHCIDSVLFCDASSGVCYDAEADEGAASNGPATATVGRACDFRNCSGKCGVEQREEDEKNAAEEGSVAKGKSSGQEKQG